MKAYNYIYLITNLVNHKIYIGKHSSNNLDDGYMGSGILIKRSILKYGKENFTKEYLAFCDTEDKLNWLEKFYIRKYRAKDRGYNLTDGGDGGNTGISEEARKRLSETRKGVNNPMYGKNAEDFMTEDAKKEKHRKMSESSKGKHFMTDEQKQKISQLNKGRTSFWKDKHLPEETKLKMREAWIRRKNNKVNYEKMD